ncbi:unnamed protein product [Cercopithifilaria johnstoni]|uniref:Uncharacterized protein n=1 Tax=Cercopithifilaria johnstoni TaxID=2874296 RepID=A0A8J2MBP3_9BILA|nr:unnamed protein product [Cercopithifilaria johnstoni]
MFQQAIQKRSTLGVLFWQCRDTQHVRNMQRIVDYNGTTCPAWSTVLSVTMITETKVVTNGGGGGGCIDDDRGAATTKLHAFLHFSPHSYCAFSVSLFLADITDKEKTDQ